MIARRSIATPRSLSARSSIGALLFAVALALFVFFPSCAEPLQPTLDVTPASRTLVTGESAKLTVTRRFPGGAVDDVSTKVTYTTSDKLLATVSPQGVVTAVGDSGSVLIRVFDPTSDAVGVSTFTIVRPRVATIDLTPSPAVVMQRGTTRQFQAFATYTNGTRKDVTAQVLWSSTNEAAATVENAAPDKKGLVTAVAPGDATILATDAESNVQGRSTVFVTGTAAQLAAIMVTPNPATFAVGQTQPFKAVGVFSDGTSRDVTSEVTWTSSRADVATIDAKGEAKGVAVGETTITATGTVSSTAVKGSAAASVR
jgi:hypothetical protein